MADEFESFLAEALAPPDRHPDRRFVGQVQARIALEARLDAERRSIVQRLGLELIALIAFAGGLVWAARTEPVMAIASQSPWVLIGGLLAVFGLVVLAIASRPEEPAAESR